jgi:hypothetical protein
VATGVLCLGTWPGTATATAGTVDAAVWAMDETSGTTMADSSGNGNDGTTYNVVMTGDTGYVFHPEARSKVVVPDSPTLDPGSAGFSYSVDLQSEKVPASGTDYDVIRKGVGSTSGGEYKLEIVYAKGQGRAFCLVKDAAGTSATIKGVTNVTDGAVHTVTCTKTATSLVLQVDGLAPRTRTVSTGIGSISNSSALVIGAKTPTVKSSSGDWYDGALLDARVGVDTSAP